MRSRSHGQALTHEYLDALKHQRRLSPATLSNYGRALGVLHELMGKRPLDSLEAAEVRRYVAVLHGRGLSPRSLALGSTTTPVNTRTFSPAASSSVWRWPERSRRGRACS